MVLALASRRAAVASLLFVAASTAIFHQLGDQGLGNDEAHYAHIANGIRATGEWLHLRDVDGRPYLHKSPLYFWLSAATQPLFSDEELAQRAWAAAFGVGSVVLTGLLGGLLFTPEIGLLAIVTLGWVASFSLSASKRLWYVYPVFPLIALAIAACLGRLFDEITRRLPSPRARSVWLGLSWAVLSVLATSLIAKLVWESIPDRAHAHRHIPWELYRSVGPANDPSARFVLLRYPGERSNHTRSYYDAKLGEVIRIAEPGELRPLLDEVGPLVVLVGGGQPQSLTESVAQALAPRGAIRFQDLYGTAFAAVPEGVLPSWLLEHADAKPAGGSPASSDAHGD